MNWGQWSLWSVFYLVGLINLDEGWHIYKVKGYIGRLWMEKKQVLKVNHETK